MSDCKRCGAEVDVSQLYCCATCAVEDAVAPDVLAAYHAEQDIRTMQLEGERDHYRAKWLWTREQMGFVSPINEVTSTSDGGRVE